jgi:hypothetical protein
MHKLDATARGTVCASFVDQKVSRGHGCEDRTEDQQQLSALNLPSTLQELVTDHNSAAGWCAAVVELEVLLLYP